MRFFESGITPADGPDPSHLYFITELGINGNLFDAMDIRSLQSPVERFIVYYGVTKGLDFLHGKNKLHRDIKPSNVLLDENNYPLLADFGFFRHLSAGKLTPGCGSPGYMAPEVVTASYGPKADIYSLGMLIYVFESGKAPPDLVVGECLDQAFLDERRCQFAELIRACSNFDPAKRNSAADCLNWLDRNAPRLLPPDELSRFEAYKRALETAQPRAELTVETLPQMAKKSLFAEAIYGGLLIRGRFVAQNEAEGKRLLATVNARGCRMASQISEHLRVTLPLPRIESGASAPPSVVV